MRERMQEEMMQEGSGLKHDNNQSQNKNKT